MRPIDRRQFLVRATASGALVLIARVRGARAQEVKEGGAAAAAAPKLEMRSLCGQPVPRLGLGCAPLAQIKSDEKAIALVRRALDLGVRYFDVAPDNEENRAEILLGKALEGVKRDELWITTKTEARKADAAKKAIAGSLARLRTAYVDTMLIPAVLDREAASDSESVLDELQRAKKQQTVRHLGIHSNKSPTYARRAMDRYPYEMAMVPINPTDPDRFQFVKSFLPYAAEKKIGVVANQIFPAGKGSPAVPLARKDCIVYALAQTHVDVIAPTCGSIEMLDEVYAAATTFTPPTDAWLRDLEKRAKTDEKPPEQDESEERHE
jgi:diketogulonate reductase-like aldo/keto reductase